MANDGRYRSQVRTDFVTLFSQITEICVEKEPCKLAAVCVKSWPIPQNPNSVVGTAKMAKTYDNGNTFESAQHDEAPT